MTKARQAIEGMIDDIHSKLDEVILESVKENAMTFSTDVLSASDSEEQVESPSDRVQPISVGDWEAVHNMAQHILIQYADQMLKSYSMMMQLIKDLSKRCGYIMPPSVASQLGMNRAASSILFMMLDGHLQAMTEGKGTALDHYSNMLKYVQKDLELMDKVRVENGQEKDEGEKGSEGKVGIDDRSDVRSSVEDKGGRRSSVGSKEKQRTH